MRNKELAFISSSIGSLILLFSSIAAFYVFGPEPLWLPTKAGSENFSPKCLTLLLALIPVGSLLGGLTSIRKQFQGVSWLSWGLSWLVGCTVGGVILFPTAVLLGVLHPLLVCGLGLAFTLLIFWIVMGATKPS